MVSKVLEKNVNNRNVDHLEKYGLFSDFQCGFRSSGSNANLLKVTSGRIPRPFKDTINPLQLFFFLLMSYVVLDYHSE